ncbi:MAG: transposase [Gemmatimonadetes bacterium]|nr:transposase [Gemmatimonadota bacterium]
MKAITQIPSLNASKRLVLASKIWTNGIESFWSGIKRGIMGVYQKMGKKHLWRYVTEFVARQNMRVKDTIDQMKLYVLGD